MTNRFLWVTLLAVAVVLSAPVSRAAGLSASGTADELVVPSSTCGPYFIIPIEVDGGLS
jgi:hypothetical protein